MLTWHAEQFERLISGNKKGRGLRGGLDRFYPWVGVTDLVLGAHLMPERTMAITRGWWVNQRMPLPHVYPIEQAMNGKTWEARAHRWKRNEWRTHYVDEFTGENVYTYPPIASRRSALIRKHMDRILLELEDLTGYRDIRSHAEAMDAVRVAPDAWSRALFALDRAARVAFSGWT